MRNAIIDALHITSPLMFQFDLWPASLIDVAMGGCLLLIVSLILSIMIERLAWQLASDYRRRREARFAEAVLGVLIDQQTLQSLSSGARRARLGSRPFDTLILERMLIQQASELRGGDRQNMARVFEDSGLVERAIRQMRSLRWWQRFVAAQKLGAMRSARAVPALICAAGDRNPTVRLAALRALGDINDASAYPLLLQALEERATATPMLDIVLAIGSSISPYLLERFESLRDTQFRIFYVRLLGLFQEPIALDALLPLVEDADPILRYEAIVALGAIGDARAVEALHTVLHDADEPIRLPKPYVDGIY
jgi:hypothetical protein